MMARKSTDSPFTADDDSITDLPAEDTAVLGDQDDEDDEDEAEIRARYLEKGDPADILKLLDRTVKGR